MGGLGVVNDGLARHLPDNAPAGERKDHPSMGQPFGDAPEIGVRISFQFLDEGGTGLRQQGAQARRIPHDDHLLARPRRRLGEGKAGRADRQVRGLQDRQVNRIAGMDHVHHGGGRAAREVANEP